MTVVERVNYISVGKTVGIYVTIDGEQKLFWDKERLLSQLREGVEGITIPDVEWYAQALIRDYRREALALIEEAEKEGDGK